MSVFTAALGEARDDTFDGGALIELCEEFGLLSPLEVVADQALFMLDDEDGATVVGSSLGGDACLAHGAARALRSGKGEQASLLLVALVPNE